SQPAQTMSVRDCLSFTARQRWARHLPFALTHLCNRSRCGPERNGSAGNACGLQAKAGVAVNRMEKILMATAAALMLMSASADAGVAERAYGIASVML